jgi:glyoxylase-like metal-dependent hydrolase (beta-lactamase superfamily II)
MTPVQIERFYLGCLAHASYGVGSEGVAAIIDPRRDVDIYLDAAVRNGWRIEHIIETHLHADFVSGHLELAERTGARIYIGAGSGAQFPHIAVSDGDEILFGECRLRFLQTPGHTMESICIVMTDLGRPERPEAVFTGDTLFTNGVGRPDLHADPEQAKRRAASLFASLKLLQTLAPAALVLPRAAVQCEEGRSNSAEER